MLRWARPLLAQAAANGQVAAANKAAIPAQKMDVDGAIELLEMHRHRFNPDTFEAARVVFVKNNIDVQTLAHLDLDELHNLGIHSLGTRARVMAVVESAHSRVTIGASKTVASAALVRGSSTVVVVALVIICIGAAVAFPLTQIAQVGSAVEGAAQAALEAAVSEKKSSQRR